MLAGAITLGASLHGHGHTLSLSGDAGHVEVALDHALDDGLDCAHHAESVLVRAGCCGAPAGLDGPGSDEASHHSFHVRDGGAGVALRELVPAPAALALAHSVGAWLGSPARDPDAAPCRQAHCAGPHELLRSTVLRI